MCVDSIGLITLLPYIVLSLLFSVFCFPIAGDDDMQGVPVTVLANKQDLPHAVSVEELINKLQLNQVKDREWRVQGTCATNGDGLYESIIEFSKMVKNYQSSHH